MLVRDGSVIPEIKPAQSTMQLDWSQIELAVFAKTANAASGLICLPSDNVLRAISLRKSGETFALTSDPLAGKVSWNTRLNPND
jgi:alpha-D-xyloside xylohydrolase